MSSTITSRMDERLNINRKRAIIQGFTNHDKKKKKEKHDFVLIIGSERIFTERKVLASRSKYFQAMFSHDTLENQRGEVEMFEVDYECVKACIDYIYEKEFFITSEKFDELMFVAGMLQLEKLCDVIEDNMIKDLNIKSFFSLQNIAEKYECGKLKAKCENFAIENFELIAEDNGFQDISKSLLMNLLKLKNMKMSEEAKLKNLIAWVKRDEKTRTRVFMELLQCVDLSDIPSVTKIDLMKHEMLIRGDSEILLKISMSMLDHFVTTEEKQKTRSNLMYIDKNRDNMQIFDPRENKIYDTPAKKPHVNLYSIVTLGGYVYVIAFDKRVLRLKYSEGKTWERMADMVTGHGTSPPVTVASGYIFVIGGLGISAINTVERYDPSRNEWSVRDDNRSIQFAKILGSRGVVYSIGGKTDSRYVSDVYKMDIVTYKWNSVRSMNEEKGCVSATEMGGTIFVAGGYTDEFPFLSKSLEKYDPYIDQWTVLSEMRIARSHFKLLSCDGCLYAVGGRHSSPGSIEKYDVSKKEWKLMVIKGDEMIDIHDCDIINSH